MSDPEQVFCHICGDTIHIRCTECHQPVCGHHANSCCGGSSFQIPDLNEAFRNLALSDTSLRTVFTTHKRTAEALWDLHNLTIHALSWNPFGDTKAGCADFRHRLFQQQLNDLTPQLVFLQEPLRVDCATPDLDPNPVFVGARSRFITSWTGFQYEHTERGAGILFDAQVFRLVQTVNIQTCAHLFPQNLHRFQEICGRMAILRLALRPTSFVTTEFNFLAVSFHADRDGALCDDFFAILSKIQQGIPDLNIQRGIHIIVGADFNCDIAARGYFDDRIPGLSTPLELPLLTPRRAQLQRIDFVLEMCSTGYTNPMVSDMEFIDIIPLGSPGWMKSAVNHDPLAFTIRFPLRAFHRLELRPPNVGAPDFSRFSPLTSNVCPFPGDYLVIDLSGRYLLGRIAQFDNQSNIYALYAEIANTPEFRETQVNEEFMIGFIVSNGRIHVSSMDRKLDITHVRQIHYLQDQNLHPDDDNPSR